MRIFRSAAVALILLAALPATATAQRDFSSTARNVLPPGQAGLPPSDQHATDQIPLYDGLTPLFDRVGSQHLRRYFKSARFGVGGQGPTSVTHPRAGLRIVRDRWGVPHIYGRSRDLVAFGVGWVSVEDRAVLMEALRGPGRVAALDVPGVDAFGLATSLRSVTPSAQTEQFLARQGTVLRRQGATGRRLLRDIDLYVAGINAAYRAGRGAAPAQPWTRNDVFAIVSLLAGIFGQGGGDEARNAELLDGLRDRLGASRGRTVFDDLRQQQDAEHAHTLRKRFPYGRLIRRPRGNVVLDNGSFQSAEAGVTGGVTLGSRPRPRLSSNALLLSRSRSRVGHPLWAAGPQVGYFYPEILMEMDVHGGGIDARGVGVPGFAVAMLIGRGPDFGWSLTSASNDIVDQYSETLCGDDLHYVYRGRCRQMGSFFVGTLEGSPFRSRLVFHTTVHGPVVGYARANGRRVAISEKRSTRGREIVSGLMINDLMTGRVRSARSFLRSARQFEVTFNIFYEDDRDTAVYSSGRLPLRHPSVDMSLPTIGDGRFEWQGFLPGGRHPQGINPRGGAILNWNQKPAPGWSAADDQWGLGSVHRVELFRPFVSRRRRHTLATLASAMNGAATQDLRTVQVLPAIDRLLKGTPAPNARTRRMLLLLRDWRRHGSSRLDRDLDDKIDHPGAAIMDAAWERIGRAVLSPVIGSELTDQLADMHDPDNEPSPQGSAYGDGWYSYVDKDLRRVTGAPERDPFATRFCGRGSRSACRRDIWGALDTAGERLAAEQGDNPDAWRADATGERIRFEPGVLPRTMRWTNRPTFQQLLVFSGHRPRGARRQVRRPPAFTGAKGR
ncbi:MAG TPA: penicillin acylase family protein [Thermoleophilaceae bacterium]|nr:penicillin acylase family protein [Thermoleophilaceae bacterium]